MTLVVKLVRTVPSTKFIKTEMGQVIFTCNFNNTHSFFVSLFLWL